MEPGPNNNPAAVNGYFTIGRDSQGTAQTVVYRISGSADNGVDYTGTNGLELSGSVTFGANETVEQIDVKPLLDNLVEFDENLTLTLVPTNGYVADPGFASATMTLRDHVPTNLFTTNLFLNAPIGIDYSPTTNALCGATI